MMLIIIMWSSRSELNVFLQHTYSFIFRPPFTADQRTPVTQLQLFSIVRRCVDDSSVYRQSCFELCCRSDLSFTFASLIDPQICRSPLNTAAETDRGSFRGNKIWRWFFLAVSISDSLSTRIWTSTDNIQLLLLKDRQKDEEETWTTRPKRVRQQSKKRKCLSKPSLSFSSPLWSTSHPPLSLSSLFCLSTSIKEFIPVLNVNVLLHTVINRTSLGHKKRTFWRFELGLNLETVTDIFLKSF